MMGPFNIMVDGSIVGIVTERITGLMKNHVIPPCEQNLAIMIQYLASVCQEFALCYY